MILRPAGTFLIGVCLSVFRLGAVDHDVGALVDIQAGVSSERRNWLGGGEGKFRHDDGVSAGVTQASLTWRMVWADVEIFNHVNVDLDTARSDPGGRLDAIENHVIWRMRDAGDWRVGSFFPPMSLENDGPAWSVSRSITPSVINAWIGEELRGIGVDWSRPLRLDGWTLTPSVALFGWNDPAGSLLAYRGWASHDRQSGLGDRLPLARSPVFEDGARIGEQALHVEPFVELDDRPGIWGAIEITAPGGSGLTFLNYDNHANGTHFSDGQYAWRTKFDHVALRARLGDGHEILVQAIRGSTRMGFKPLGGDVVRSGFHSEYLAWAWRRETVSLFARIEQFVVNDRDSYVADVLEDDHGSALTLAGGWRPEGAWAYRAEVGGIRYDDRRIGYEDRGRRKSEHQVRLSATWSY